MSAAERRCRRPERDIFEEDAAVHLCNVAPETSNGFDVPFASSMAASF
jgi:hypothetical protein